MSFILLIWFYTGINTFELWTQYFSINMSKISMTFLNSFNALHKDTKGLRFCFLSWGMGGFCPFVFSVLPSSTSTRFYICSGGHPCRSAWGTSKAKGSCHRWPHSRPPFRSHLPQKGSGGWGGPSGVRLAAAWLDPPASFCGTTWVHPPDSMPIGEAAKGGWDLPVLSWGFPAALSHSSPVCQQPFVRPQPTPTTLLSNGDELHMFLGIHIASPITHPRCHGSVTIQSVT